MNAMTRIEWRRALLFALRRGDTGKDHRKALHDLIIDKGITRERAAELIGVSQHTIDSWLKPRTSRSHNRCPMWAVELLKAETGE